MKKIFILISLLALAGCATLQERLAKRVGCDPSKLLLNNQLNVPAYSQYDFTCEGKTYVCKDAPFHKSCEEKGSSQPADATPKKK